MSRTVRVTYTGPHPSVQVLAFGVHATRGVPVEVTEEQAEALTAGPAWKRAPKPKKTKPKADEAEADQG